jgi:hypothetical protein
MSQLRVADIPRPRLRGWSRPNGRSVIKSVTTCLTGAFSTCYVSQLLYASALALRDGLARQPNPRDHQVTVAAQLTANGYSPDQAAEILLFARKNASPDQWINVLAGLPLSASATGRRSHSPSQPPSLLAESASASAS